MPDKEKDKPTWRASRTISVRPDQDAWLDELFPERGKVSEFFRALLDKVILGQVKLEPGDTGDPKTATARARAYMMAKEAAITFEDDVVRILTDALPKKAGFRIDRNAVFNEDGVVYLADAAVRRADGSVVLAAGCKSNPRPDRLELALGEAIIGKQKTGAPVLVVVPYLLDESAEVADKFRAVGAELVTIGDFGDRAAALLAAAAKTKR
jgi:hypothetical protein